MKLRDVEGWKKKNDANPPSEPYGHRVITYAEDWANFMEREMALGWKLEDVADSTSHEADTDGITGSMFGAAVSTLAAVWEHGDALRRWHNLKTQIGTEGGRANESGSTLNPALLNSAPQSEYPEGNPGVGDAGGLMGTAESFRVTSSPRW
jgi:hypothetical protein